MIKLTSNMPYSYYTVNIPYMTDKSYAACLFEDFDIDMWEERFDDENIRESYEWNTAYRERRPVSRRYNCHCRPGYLADPAQYQQCLRK